MKGRGKRMLAFFCISWLALGGVTLGAESPPVSMFAVPAAQLRKSQEPSEPKVLLHAVIPLATDLESSANERETPLQLSMQRFAAMNGTALLMKPEFHPEPAGLAGFLESKVLSPIVTCEVVSF